MIKNIMEAFIGDFSKLPDEDKVVLNALLYTESYDYATKILKLQNLCTQTPPLATDEQSAALISITTNLCHIYKLFATYTELDAVDQYKIKKHIKKTYKLTNIKFIMENIVDPYKRATYMHRYVK